MHAHLQTRSLLLHTTTALAIVLATISCGDDQNGIGTVTPIVEVAQGSDDGNLRVEKPILAGAVGGLLDGDTDAMRVGILAGQRQHIYRALYRFDISDWTSGDITFRFHCLAPSAGDNELIVTPDFPEFPSPPVHQSNIGSWFNLDQAGVSVTTFTPATRWWDIVLPGAVVADKVDGGYIAIMLKLADESVTATDLSLYTGYEYADPRTETPPRLSWEAK